ncbi:hypothetical protein J2S42_005033 [Catenuloplanes indicus]|uniref:Uncharacterized protein n=1 Tax=Catenuloplanes indicus TaxID=137267 RepID=A0AAE3W2Q0_9ACTN|nr:hypothetical protein [Catenuloplanes indicus]
MRCSVRVGGSRNRAAPMVEPGSTVKRILASMNWAGGSG